MRDGCHRLCSCDLRARNTLFGLELLYRSGQFLLVLALLGIATRLHLLLCLEARNLLCARRCRTHRQRACRCRFLVAAHEARYVRNADERNDGDQGDDHRHTLLERRLCLRL
jgi:hypothetical protein